MRTWPWDFEPQDWYFDDIKTPALSKAAFLWEYARESRTVCELCETANRRDADEKRAAVVKLQRLHCDALWWRKEFPATRWNDLAPTLQKEIAAHKPPGRITDCLLSRNPTCNLLGEAVVKTLDDGGQFLSFPKWFSALCSDWYDGSTLRPPSGARRLLVFELSLDSDLDSLRDAFGDCVKRFRESAGIVAAPQKPPVEKAERGDYREWLRWLGVMRLMHWKGRRGATYSLQGRGKMKPKQSDTLYEWRQNAIQVFQRLFQTSELPRSNDIGPIR